VGEQQVFCRAVVFLHEKVRAARHPVKFGKVLGTEKWVRFSACGSQDGDESQSTEESHRVEDVRRDKVQGTDERARVPPC
jgi:hypothetical protein